MRPPTMAVINPPKAGKPLAIAIPKHNGRAISDTNNPEVISLRKFSLRPLGPSAGTCDDTGVKAAERFIITTPKTITLRANK
jgi:hypothetical protein